LPSKLGRKLSVTRSLIFFRQIDRIRSRDTGYSRDTKFALSFEPRGGLRGISRGPLLCGLRAIKAMPTERERPALLARPDGSRVTAKSWSALDYPAFARSHLCRTTWIALYKGAMLECNPQRRRERITLANDAIKQCLKRIDPCKDNHRLEPTPTVRASGP
jgi:hypothetical protein